MSLSTLGNFSFLLFVGYVAGEEDDAWITMSKAQQLGGAMSSAGISLPGCGQFALADDATVVLECGL